VAVRYRFLDTGPLGLACRRPNPGDVNLIHLCVSALWSSEGVTVVLPEIADYELRRELIRIGATGSLRILNSLRNKLRFLEINTKAMSRAAELWALARGTGLQTADDTSLDGDVILAAQALEFTGIGDDLVVITDNNKHLARFVTTSSWTAYSPTRAPGTN
jgi:predicted nucleic acid-binding protein